MSTFKIQPVYAELLMGWLSCCEKEIGDMSWDSVLGLIQWRFKGGQMGAYPAVHPTPCSETYFPDGTTSDLVAEGEWGKNRGALRRIVRTQMGEKRRTRAAQCAWVHSFALVKSASREWLTVGKASTGLSAVYLVLRNLWNSSPQPSALDGDLFRYIREMSVISAAASHLSPAVVSELCDQARLALGKTTVMSIRKWARDSDRVLRYAMSRLAAHTSRTRGMSLQLGGAMDADLSDLGARKYHIGNLRLLVTSGCAVTSCMGQLVALSTSDLQRLRTFLLGASSGLFATVTQAVVAPGPERFRAAAIGNAYCAQIDRLLQSTKRIQIGDEVKVCKGYKRAFGAFLGELAGPLCAGETRELWMEAEATTSHGELDVAGWIAEIRGWSVPTAFNLGKVYKLCPAPDASPGGTMLERHEMVSNRNTMQPSVAELFRVELRAQILRAYIRTPGVKLMPRSAKPPWWDAYLHRDFDNVPSDEIHQWLAWEGTAVMPSRSPDDPAVWKDSGLGYDTMDEGMDPDRSRLKGNMLTRMVFDSALPMPGVRHNGHLRDHKVDIKPEGYKDPARAIYSGNLRDRLNQSWMEAAVEGVACNHPSYMIGATAEQREARTRMVVDRPEAFDEVALYYSFDISGWSPRMPPEPQHISHDIWGQLFGEPLFSDAKNITDGSRVYMNKGGYQAWYINNGANFEGYNGKEMTMILITLMSLSIKVWRRDLVRGGLCDRKSADKLSAGLLAYIDDGLAKLTVKREGAVRKFAIYKQTCERVFRSVGYNIEPSKCYPSDRFAIFLNESYLMGRHVSHGTRAAMTLNAENTEEHTTLLERTSAAAGGCAGAVMAGLDVMAGYMLMAYTWHAHITEWLPHSDPILAAVWSLMPRAWGGLGAPTALQLGTSGSGASFEEGARTMQIASQVSTIARCAYLGKARGGLVLRSSKMVLSAPLGGSSPTGTMTLSRVGPVVRKALVNLRSKGVLSPLAQTFLRYGSDEAFEAYAAAVVPLGKDTVIQEQLLVDLKDVHPHALFQRFTTRLEKSSTLFRLAGGRELGRMKKANREDVTRSYQNIRSFIHL